MMMMMEMANDDTRYLYTVFTISKSNGMVVFIRNAEQLYRVYSLSKHLIL